MTGPMTGSAAERRDRAQAIIVGLASLLLLTLVALLVVTLAWRSDRDTAEEGERAVALAQAGADAQKAARSAVTEMTTYDHATIDEDFSWVDDAGTAKFREHYAEVSAPIKKLVVQMKAKAEGTVIASAADVRDADHVTVLLFVDQTLTNPGQAQKGLDQPRVTMSMVRQDGEWLVDDVALNNITGE